MPSETMRADTSHEVDWEKVPKLTCVICCFPRTGSSLLSYALHDSGLAGHPSEYFGPMDEAMFAVKWGLPARYSLRAYLRSMAGQTMTENGVMAVKLFIPNLSHLLQRARDEFGPELSEMEILEECFPNPRYVFLRRRDRVRQAISFMRAMNTMEFERRKARPDSGLPPGMNLDPGLDKISSYIGTFARQEREWRSFFKRNEITAHEVFYEDLASDYQSTVFKVLDSLGITPPAGLRLPPPRLVRQSDETTEQIAARYAEYQARVLAGSRPGNTGIAYEGEARYAC